MTATSELIDTLVAGAAPVRRLRPPLVRAALWLGGAGLLLGLVAIGHGVRTDVAERLREPAFVASLVAALATAVLAAVAAFAVSLPDRSRWWLVLPVPGLAVWLATIGYGCLAHWVAIGPDGTHIADALPCAAVVVFTSIPLAVVLAAMLRYAALLRAGAVALMGGLAVAAITSAALALLHAPDATAMILISNLGTAAAITGLAGVFGHRLLHFLAHREGAPVKNGPLAKPGPGR